MLLIKYSYKKDTFRILKQPNCMLFQEIHFKCNYEDTERKRKVKEASGKESPNENRQNTIKKN